MSNKDINSSLYDMQRTIRNAVGIDMLNATATGILNDNINSGLSDLQRTIRDTAGIDILNATATGILNYNINSEFFDLQKTISKTAGVDMLNMTATGILSNNYFDNKLISKGNVISQLPYTSISVASGFCAAQAISSTYAEMVSDFAIHPSIKWFNSFDISSLVFTIPDFEIDYELLEKLKGIYLKAMYEAKWCPYASYGKDETLFDSIEEIILTSRGVSQRREKRIDKAIFSYYTEKRIKSIKSQWKKNSIDKHLKKSLIQSIDAYLRGEYVLTISCLATMWEGLIYIKAKDVLPEERKRQKSDLTKADLVELIELNDYDKILSDYFNNYIMSQCDGIEDVKEGVPNRHGTSHSWYKKYPNKKAALNAILFTDFILNLEPKTTTEETSNGQT